MRKLERDALLADRQAVLQLLELMHVDDVLGRLSFETRLRQISNRLAQLDQVIENTASVALFFGGEPVFGSESIDAEFTTRMLSAFQAMVNKRLGSEVGSLGERGPLPQGTQGPLAISELLRGSVGFLLEEEIRNQEIAPTVVRGAVEQIIQLVHSAAAEDPDEFAGTVESLDHRLLLSLREFFRTLDERHGTIRIVDNDNDRSLDSRAIARGRQRVETTQIDEHDSETMIGELLGLLPDQRRFEMRLRDTGEIIRGSVAAKYAVDYLELIERREERLAGRMWRAKMKIREIREPNKPPRRLYSLLGLLEALDPLA
jgi:hypothetical protein